MKYNIKIKYYITNMDKLIEEYLKTLSEKELKAYNIAKDHLQSSFNIKKSNGYLEWVKKQTQ